jgi:hypothetical protein
MTRVGGTGILAGRIITTVGSHGCVNLPDAAAEFIYNWADVGRRCGCIISAEFSPLSISAIYGIMRGNGQPTNAPKFCRPGIW